MQSFLNAGGKCCGQPDSDFARYDPLFQYGRPEDPLQHDRCILSDDTVLERAGHAFHRPRHVHSIPARFLFLIRFHPRIPLPDHAYYYGYGRAETFSGLSFHPSGVFDPNYLRDCVGSPAPAAMGSYL